VTAELHEAPLAPAADPALLRIRGARLHNLRNVSLDLPRGRLIVLTGVSGSGKSTLAFDVIHKEGQRQYLESLGMVTDALRRGDVDAVDGLSPSISVEQRLANRSPRSTVGTATEVFTYLRVLYARLGYRTCEACGTAVPPELHLGDDADDWDDEADPPDGPTPHDAEPGSPGIGPGSYPCPGCGAPVERLTMAHFSFNKLAGACPRCTGIGEVVEPRLERLIDEGRSVADGGVLRWDRYELERYSVTLPAAARHYGFSFDLDRPIGALDRAARALLVYGVDSDAFRALVPSRPAPATVREGWFEGVATGVLRRYLERDQDPAYRARMEPLLVRQPCPDCGGTRLRLESRRVVVAGRTIVEIAALPLAEVLAWVTRLGETLRAADAEVARAIVDDLQARIRRLTDVGLGYLALDRASVSLSGGEAQRLRLASLLGSGLTGVLYVLDEPTTGLHPRDTGRVLGVLGRLRDLGNTVLVVEHDLDVIRAADHVVDMGPGAGRDGGRVVVAGPPAVVAACAGSVTGRHLALATRPADRSRRPESESRLTVRGARAHNLRGVTASFPLGRLVAVTGVSGSGKSSLVFDVLDRAARAVLHRAAERPGAHDALTGLEELDGVITIDQGAIGRSSRSNPATFSDAWTGIRDAFAGAARTAGADLRARDFSFNVPGGRCERCEGAGTVTVRMHFLPDVEVRCPACRGRRFRPAVLRTTFGGLAVDEVLRLTVDEARPVFAAVAAVAPRLDALADVGLGYLPLGQTASTLSGGEAQRLKLARELGRRSTSRTLYLLDEPSTGLHPADTARLVAVLQRLVDAGGTVIVVEHNLDIIAAADHVIDLGPGGGPDGGWIVATGTPEVVAATPGSVTGEHLRSVLGAGAP
jgi:excinuclease ABC subunit A